MVITFLCPAGHKLTSPPELAGKPGKCPKCGATFRVPVPEPDEPPAPSDAPPAKAGPWADQPAPARATAPPAGQSDKPTMSAGGNGTAPPPATPPGDSSKVPAAPPAVAEPELFLADDSAGGDDSHIVFLCPNGHRLHGPARLAGQPGQCPECGIKFLVPSPDDELSEDPVVDQELLSQIQVNVHDSPRGSKGLLERLTGSGSKKDRPAEQAATTTDSLPALFRLLWACKDQGGLVEVHLEEGKLVVPDQFAAHLSAGEHAVFGLREAGGTHSVTVVPWSAITHVTLRGLPALPRAIFNPNG